MSTLVPFIELFKKFNSLSSLERIVNQVYTKPITNWLGGEFI